MKAVGRFIKVIKATEWLFKLKFVEEKPHWFMCRLNPFIGHYWKLSLLQLNVYKQKKAILKIFCVYMHPPFKNAPLWKGLLKCSDQLCLFQIN